MDAFIISRRTWVHATLGLGALGLAAGFGYVAYDQGPEALWAAAALLAVLAVVHLVSTRDALTPLLVADDQGVRIRSGSHWHGIVWDDIGDIRIEPRDGLVRDAHVKIVSVDGQRIYTAPVGPATNTSAKRARVQLSARRKDPAF